LRKLLGYVWRALESERKSMREIKGEEKRLTNVLRWVLSTEGGEPGDKRQVSSGIGTLP